MSDIVELKEGKPALEALPPLAHSEAPELPLPPLGRSEPKLGRKFDDIDQRLIDPHGTANSGIVMPGMDGLPYRGGRIPHLKESDPKGKRPQEACKVHIEILDLDVPAHLERYRQICQVIMNGYGVMGEEKTLEDKNKLTWRIMVRWYEQYVTLAKS